jgi:Transposase DDE domain
MRGDLTIRKTRTASGATAVQVVRNEGKRRVVINHVGSAHDDSSLQSLMAQARRFVAEHCAQPGLFAADGGDDSPVFSLAQLTFVGVRHHFAREVLLACARRCGLSDLPSLFLDLALMRIIEPTSKQRTLRLLADYFDVRYAERTLYRMLPKLLAQQELIESAAIKTARDELDESFGLVLYDVTTLYFESFKEYEFQRPGFSKDQKPQQPQIVVGLLTTASGFPVMHEVFEGNTFEGHTMLDIVLRFEQRVGNCKPIVVADAAMLSKANMHELESRGYRYIVGARLFNLPRALIDQIHREVPNIDDAMKRFDTGSSGALICTFSQTRYRKDKRTLEQHEQRARELLERNEPGRRAKFVRKSNSTETPFVFDAELKERTSKLLGIKGYVTNINSEEMSDAQIVAHYHDLWRIEQAFRMSKSDLRARPIFHHQQPSIRAHMLICFIALMIGKYLEIKTGHSLRQLRDAIWELHDAILCDQRTGATHVLRMEPKNPTVLRLIDLLNLQLPH